MQRAFHSSVTSYAFALLFSHFSLVQFNTENLVEIFQCSFAFVLELLEMKDMGIVILLKDFKCSVDIQLCDILCYCVPKIDDF